MRFAAHRLLDDFEERCAFLRKKQCARGRVTAKGWRPTVKHQLSMCYKDGAMDHAKGGRKLRDYQARPVLCPCFAVRCQCLTPSPLPAARRPLPAARCPLPKPADARCWRDKHNHHQLHWVLYLLNASLVADGGGQLAGAELGAAP